jgi:hypothetical protein
MSCSRKFARLHVKWALEDWAKHHDDHGREIVRAAIMDYRSVFSHKVKRLDGGETWHCIRPSVTALCDTNSIDMNREQALVNTNSIN